jgi:hypothetical protein
LRLSDALVLDSLDVAQFLADNFSCGLFELGHQASAVRTPRRVEQNHRRVLVATTHSRLLEEKNTITWLVSRSSFRLLMTTHFL